MITITVSGAEGQEREDVMRLIEGCLANDPNNKYVQVLRAGAYTSAALPMIPKIVKVYLLEARE